MNIDEEKFNNKSANDKKSRNGSSTSKPLSKNNEDKKDVLKIKGLEEEESKPKREPLSLEELLEKKKQMEELNSKVFFI
jgi:hypothetical protein